MRRPSSLRSDLSGRGLGVRLMTEATADRKAQILNRMFGKSQVNGKKLEQ